MKRILLLLICVFLTDLFALGQNWQTINVNKNDLRAYVDTDSISGMGSGSKVEYIIKYEDLNKRTIKILYAESDCKKNLAGIKVRQKEDNELKTFTKDSAINYIHKYICSIDENNKKINWAPYMMDLEKRIKRNWYPPSNDSSKQVVVLFSIGKDGRLLEKSILKSSGDSTVDKAGLEAISNTAPFKPLPDEFIGKAVPVEFTFDYNVVSN